MKLVKSIIALAAAFAAMVGFAGDSAPFRLDTVTPSTSPAVTSLAVSWDASWIGGNANATVVIADNGTEVKRTTGAGAFTHTLSGGGRHELTYTTYIGGAAQSEIYSVTIYEPCVVTFAANGGSVNEASRIVDANNAIGTLPTPTRTGYTFAGWWTAASGGTQISASTTVTDNVTYYAQWQANTYAVTLDRQSGTDGSESVTATYDGAMPSITAPTRTGYTFGGYWTGMNGSGTQYYAASGASARAWDKTSATTLYAKWRINQYTVTFNANGGTGGKRGKQDYGLTIVAPTVTREGHTFKGWQPVVLETVPANDVTYTAQWQINQYTVTFDANGGGIGDAALPRVETTQDYGTAIVAPVATREWYNYTWSPAVAATVPASNVAYTALWDRWGDSISASKMGGRTMRELYPADYARMTTVVLEEGITELPTGFFDGCDNVTSLTLPESLLEFGREDVPSKILVSLDFDENGFKIFSGWILDFRPRNAAAVTIPEGIVGIGRGAFAEMFDLETVTMPESLRCIAKEAFKDCSWIQNLQFMSGLRHVGPSAFSDCSSLLGASFADGVAEIGASAFANCWQMQSVRIPSSVTNIGASAFSACGNIRGVTVPTQVKTMQALFPASYAKIETAEVADGETAVMDGMFAGCVSLRGGATQTDMSMIPNTVTNIGERAFQGCTSLTAFVVPDSVAAIGASVFQNCTNLWNVTLSRSLTALPDYAFDGCTRLETMVVPESVSYLGCRFFSGCSDPDSGDEVANALYCLCTNAPAYHASAYAAIKGDMTTYVLQNSRSWDGRQGSRVLPQSWNGYPITYWTPNRFDVAFDANGGRFDLASGSASTWSEQQITDTTYALPSTEPVRPGWAFEGWWTEQTGGAEVRYTTKVTATRAHTLYAHWRSLGERMTVTFNSNGGTVVVPGSQDYVPGQTFGQFPVPTRRGYLFTGWYRMPNMPGVTVTEETAIEADVTLYAHWVRDSLGAYASVQELFLPMPYAGDGETWTVQFDPGLGQLETAYLAMRVERGEKIGVLPVPTRSGYAFAGWRTTPEQDGRVTEGEEVPAADMELFAHWMPITYYVRFNPNGGSGSEAHQMFLFDEEQELDTHMFERKGFAFTGWATTPSGQVRYPENKSVVNLEEVHGKVVDLYAVWSGVGYSVLFDANGGTGIMDNQTIAVGETQNLWPCAFAYAGYTFTGWALSPTDAANGTVKYRDGAAVKNLSTSNSARVPLYAVWTSSDRTARISFDANGGSVAPDYWNCVVGTAVEAFPTPTRPGFTFAGWFTAKTGGTQVVSIANVTGAKTFYAHWNENGEVVPGDGSCTVTFNPNGGSVAETERTVSKGSSVGELPKPARTGYAFLGWFTAAEAGVQVSASTAVTGSVTYYAQWERVELPVITPGDGAVFHTDTCTVTITCATPDATIYYSANGRTPSVNARYLYEGPFTISGTTTVTAFAVKDDGQSEYVDATITYTVPEVLTLKGVLDETKLGAVTTGGEAEWAPVADETAKVDGSCAVSGTIADNDEAEHTTWIKTKVRGKGTLSFWWRIDCEPDPRGRFTYDYGSVMVDGVVVARKDGKTEWESFSTAITTDGEHEIVWTYVSDGYPPAYEEYESRMWVDGVSWSGAAFDPLPVIGGDAEVADALAGAADAHLIANVKTAAQYNAFRAWVDARGIDHQTAKDSPRAWLSYAIDAEGLVSRAFAKGDMVIASAVVEGGGSLALEVSLAGVAIGANAKAENLARVFSVEGAAKLEADAFSGENVTATFGVAPNGRLSVVVTPKSSTGTLFVRVRME